MAKFEVVFLDNSKVELQSKDEVEFFNRAQSKYVAQNSFTADSDERAVDRLCLSETLMHRWQMQLASGKDYQQQPLNHAEQEALRKNIKEGAITISNAHSELGLTKAQREKEAHDSVGAYINNLLLRAKERGIHREEQVDLNLNLFMEYSAHVKAFMRADTYERTRLGFPDADSLIQWWVDNGMKRFKDHDDAWRNSNQKYWRDSI